MTGQSQQVKEFFDDTERYLRDNVVIGIRVKYLKALLGHLKGKKVLDIGCGDGSLSNYLAHQNDLTLLDISPEMLKVAKEKMSPEIREKVVFIEGNVESMPGRERYDLILLVGVAAHLNDIPGTLKKLGSMMNPEGRLIFQYSDFSHPLSSINRFKKRLLGGVSYNYQVQQTTRVFIRQVLQQLNWRVKSEYRYFPVSPVFSIFPRTIRPGLMQFFHRRLRFLSGLGPEIILELCPNEL